MKQIKLTIFTFFVITLFTFSITADPIIFPDRGIMEGEEYLAFAEEMPAPVGGLPAIIKNVKYPEIAKKGNVQGKVYVMAFINEKGGVDDVKIIKGIGGGCDEAAIDAVKQGKFTPGKNKGKGVKVKFTMAIQFKL